MSFLSEFFAGKNYNHWEIHWGYDDVGGWLAALGVLVPVALWFFWTSLSRITSRPKKSFLFLLRVGAFVLLLLVILQPNLEFNKVHFLKNSIAVLLDDSRSMAIKTFPEEKRRLDLIRETVERSKDSFDKWKKDYQVDFFFMSDKVESVAESEINLRYRPAAVNTDLNRALADLQDHYKEKSLQGVALFSDGADLVQETSDLSPEFKKTLAGFNGPIHSFQAGTNERFKDLGIETVDSSGFGFVYQSLSVTVTLTASSMGEKNIPVVLKEGKKILVSRIVKIHPRKQRYQVELPFTPTATGKRIYSVTVPLFAGESIDSNNRHDFQIKVIRDRIRVLHLNGRPSWDSRFLREVLINNPKVDLLSFFILRTLTDSVEAPTGELSLIPFPTNLLFSEYLSSFDLVIFHNFKYSPFINPVHLDNIRDYVNNGGAFIMVGGDLSFHGGDYQRTSLEDILPVSMQRNVPTSLNEKFKVITRKKFSNHPILRLEKNEALSENIWNALPSLQGLNIGLAPLKDAQVLAAFDKKGKASYPLLVIRKPGKGRSMILASDTSWNWNFIKVGQGGSGRYYQKFWDNVISWMTDDPETRQVQIETDKEKYREGEKVLVKYRVLGEDYNPLPGLKVKLKIRYLADSGDLEIKTLETDRNGAGEYEFFPQREGFYYAKVTVDMKGGPSESETVFGVLSPKIEFQKPLINDRLLKNIAKITGGAYSVLGDKTDLASLSFPNPEVRVKTSGKSLSLWDNWWSYGMILGFLFVDWWLRRKSGLS